MTDKEEHLLVKRLTSLAWVKTDIDQESSYSSYEGLSLKGEYQKANGPTCKGQEGMQNASLKGKHRRGNRHAYKGQTGRQGASCKANVHGQTANRHACKEQEGRQEASLKGKCSQANRHVSEGQKRQDSRLKGKRNSQADMLSKGRQDASLLAPEKA
jgi:hypothetical protein